MSHYLPLLVDDMLTYHPLLWVWWITSAHYHLGAYGNLYSADQPSEPVWGSVKLQGSLGRISSATASPKIMTHLLEVLGTTRRKFTCSGNNWIVGQIVATPAWCREKENGNLLVWALLNIMESGRSYVFRCSRYVLCWRDPEWNNFFHLVLDGIS